MSNTLLLQPLLAQVALTFGVAVWFVVLRFRAVREGRLSPAYFQLNRGSRPPRELEQVGHNYQNLLELPILFYAALPLIMLLNLTDTLYALLAWSFVASRLIHTAIHTTYNHVRHRAVAFLLGALLLIIIWLRLAGQIVIG